MQQFKIKPGGFKEIRRKMILRTLPVLLIAGVAGIAISVINSKDKANEPNVLPVVIPVVLAFLGFGLYRGTNRQKALFDSYTLTITNNLITREQLNTPPVSIYFNEIKEIVKYKNGGFVIKGKDPVDLIGIPNQIENYSQLEERLASIKAITIKETVSLLQKYPAISAIITIGLMFCVYAVNNKTIVFIAGTLLVALMLWSFFKIRLSKNIDSKTKRIVWWLLVVLASIILTMIFKLMGIVDMHKH